MSFMRVLLVFVVIRMMMILKSVMMPVVAWEEIRKKSADAAGGTWNQ
jgi:hypothetical protein